jgi:hypothetical protein
LGLHSSVLSVSSVVEFRLALPSGIHQGTPTPPLAPAPYNKLMRKCIPVFGLAALLTCGCGSGSKPERPTLESTGMYATSIDLLKKDNLKDAEIAQLIRLKQAGATDQLCVDLVKAAHDHHHDFSSADSAVQLSSAGYDDTQILEMAQSDRIDILSGEAVTLKLIGLSPPTVQTIMHRRIEGLPTLTSEQIGRLKNTAMSEKQILALVEQSLTDQQAEAEITKREAIRNHSNTGFVRVRGRKPR